MQLAQMRAAENALIKRSDLFPTLKNCTKQNTTQNRRDIGHIAKMKYELASRVKPLTLFDSSHASQQDGGLSLTDDAQSSRQQIISLLDLKFDADGCLI
uniref:Uncharacterized protein n=1 Tax=Setaria digitata TaxID=48799 RepID=A0A915Q1G4_9BILA